MLVVDDEARVLACVSTFLSQLGGRFRTWTALTGEEAVRILERERVDILLTDLCLPGIDGIDVVRRALAIRPDTRVIAMSGLDVPPFASAAIRSGSLVFLQKPLQLGELAKILDEFERARSGPPLLRHDLLNLIQLMLLSGRERAVSVHWGQRHGRLAFREGKVVCASTRDHRGDEAFLEMVEWDGGWFEELGQGEVFAHEDVITTPTEELLGRAAELFAEDPTHPFGGRAWLAADLRECFGHVDGADALAAACVVAGGGQIEAEVEASHEGGTSPGEATAALRAASRAIPAQSPLRLVAAHERTIVVAPLGRDHQLFVLAVRAAATEDALAATRRLANQLLALRRAPLGVPAVRCQTA